MKGGKECDEEAQDLTNGNIRRIFIVDTFRRPP
jgi:hypothetical protein